MPSTRGHLLLGTVCMRLAIAAWHGDASAGGGRTKTALVKPSVGQTLWKSTGMMPTAGAGDALSLSGGEVHAALPERRLPALGQPVSGSHLRGFCPIGQVGEIVFGSRPIN